MKKTEALEDTGPGAGGCFLENAVQAGSLEGLQEQLSLFHFACVTSALGPSHNPFPLPGILSWLLYLLCPHYPLRPVIYIFREGFSEHSLQNKCPVLTSVSIILYNSPLFISY